MDIRIQKCSPVPLYYQIAESFEAELQRSPLEEGCRLMTEKELARQLQVALVTVRHAMQILVDKQVILRKRGAGTFLAHQGKEAAGPAQAEESGGE